jgi:hypothetical protein
MSAAVWSQLLSAAAAVALLVALVVTRPVVAWLAAGLALVGACATQSFGPTALLLSWSAAAALAATSVEVGRRGALVVALAAAVGAALPAGPAGPTAPGALALLPTLAVVGAIPAMTSAWCRALQGGSGLLLAAVALLWLPVGLDGGPWPMQIHYNATLPATLAAAQHVVQETGTVLALRPPALGFLATLWPMAATALVAAQLVVLRRVSVRSGLVVVAPGLLVASAVLVAGMSLASGWSTPDLVWTPAAVWLVRALLAGWLLVLATDRPAALATGALTQTGVRLQGGLRWLALVGALAGVTCAALWLPLWLGPLWWRDPLAAAWLGLTSATLTRTLQDDDGDIVAALADALAFASATAVVGGSAAGAAVAGALS